MHQSRKTHEVNSSNNGCIDYIEINEQCNPIAMMQMVTLYIDIAGFNYKCLFEIVRCIW